MSAAVIAASLVNDVPPLSTWEAQGDTSFVIPAGAQVGQLAFALAGGGESSAVPVFPAGWNTLASGPGGGNASDILAWKRLVLADIGSTVTPTNCWVVTAVGYTNAADPIMVVPRVQSSTGDNSGVTFAARDAGELHPDSLMLRAIYVSSNYDPTVDVPPSAGTSRGSRRRSYWGVGFVEQDVAADGSVAASTSTFDFANNTAYYQVEIPPVYRVVGTPSLFGSNIAYQNGSSLTVALPAGTTAGKRAVVFIEHAYYPSNPAGWTTLFNGSGGSYSIGGVWTKVLTAADITAGSVTINFGGSYPGVIGIAILNNSSGVRETNVRVMAGNGSMSSSSGVDDQDYALYWCSERGNGAQSVNRGTSLQSLANSEASGRLYGEDLSADGVVTATYTHGSGGGLTFDAQVFVKGAVGGTP